MGGEQSLDKMSGWRKALPFTFRCMLIGGLALAAFPLFSGFFSKDFLLYEIADRGGLYWVLYAAGYIGAIFTVFYTFRILFRPFWGKPCEQAVSLEEGHQWHAPEPFNPGTHEVEDTDVGFPGPEHNYAEESRSMRIPMAILAVLAVIAGVVQLPYEITHVLGSFLEPTFADSLIKHEPNNGLETFGLVLSVAISAIFIPVTWLIWVKRPGTSARMQQRFRALYELFSHKWYFDELINALIVRPFSWLGRWFQNTFERVVVDGLFVGGTTSIVKAGSAAVRSLQTGLLRSYAGLVVLGVAAALLYFLIRAA
jgi:NADH-quinone oxidoreductase subunit L